MKGSDVLDRLTVVLRISPYCTEEMQRDILRRLDESPFTLLVQAQVQRALNASMMNDVQAEVRR